MTKTFNRLMLEQVQEKLNQFLPLINRPVPRAGWIQTIRKALGLSSALLAKRLGCTRSNVIFIEEREQKGTITLETLENVAKSLNCKFVYCLVPIISLDKQLEDQARTLAKKRISAINHSMQLEKQELTTKQLQQQEDDLVQELLQGNLKKLWADDEF